MPRAFAVDGVIDTLPVVTASDNWGRHASAYHKAGDRHPLGENNFILEREVGSPYNIGARAQISNVVQFGTTIPRVNRRNKARLDICLMIRAG